VLPELAHEARIDTPFIDPAEPWQNGSSESANNKLRDQRLALQRREDRIDPKILIEESQRECNEVTSRSKATSQATSTYLSHFADCLTTASTARSNTSALPLQRQRDLCRMIRRHSYSEQSSLGCSGNHEVQLTLSALVRRNPIREKDFRRNRSVIDIHSEL
jgi:hypothetical protein